MLEIDGDVGSRVLTGGWLFSTSFCMEIFFFLVEFLATPLFPELFSPFFD